MENPIFLNFKFGTQPKLPTNKTPGTVYITEDSKKLFVDKPTEGSTERICLGDFQLVPWTKSGDVATPSAALNSWSLKDTNTLYITVESATGATAMWRYSGSEFKAISNSEEIADIVADISDLNTAVASLEGKVIHYGEQDHHNTPGSEIKRITCADNFALYEGALLSVYMCEGNTHQFPQLSINGGASHELKTNEFANFNESASNWDSPGHVLFVYHDNAWWVADSELRRRVKEIKNTANAAMPKSGGTFTGAITVPAPTANGHAATKLYVDSAVGTINTNISNINKDLKDNYMPKEGGTFTGSVSFAAGTSLTINDPTANGHAANKQYVDDTASAALQEITGVINGVKSDILGKKDDSTEDFEGTVKGAYTAAETAATAAANAQKDVDTLEGVVAGKAPTNHASTATTYGAGSSTNYGHVKLSDATNVTSANGGAATGIAASAYAVKLAYDRGSLGVTDAATAQTTAENAATAASDANNNAESRLPKVNPTLTSGHLTLAVETPTDKMHAASKGYVDTRDAATVRSAKNYTDAAKTAILGTNDDGSNYVGTVKGAYGAASTASTAASNAQKKADDAYTLAGKKTTTAEVKAQIEKYGYATTAVAQSKADAALNSANSYTDGKISTVNTTINTLKSDIGNLSNIMNFLGVTTTALTDKVTTNPIKIDNKDVTAVHGDVVVSGSKEFIYVVFKQGNDTKQEWHEIGDVSAQSQAISDLKGTVGSKPNTPTMDNTLWEEVADLRSDLGESNATAGNGTAFARIKSLETWKGTHATDYTNLEGRVDTLESWKTTHTNAYNTLNNTVSGHTTAIGTANDGASATGSLYARIKQNYNDINTASTGLKARVGALESWKGTHTTAFNTLSETVTKNGKTIDDLIAVLQWGSF